MKKRFSAKQIVGILKQAELAILIVELIRIEGGRDLRGWRP